MLKTTITFLLMLLLVAVSGQASADSSYYLTSQFTGSGNWTHDFTATPFDTSLGTLNSVTVSVDMSMTLDKLQVENSSRGTAVANAWATVTAPFTMYLGTAASLSKLKIETLPSVTQTGISLAKFDSVYDYAGASGHTYSYDTALVSHAEYKLSSEQVAALFSPDSLLRISTSGFSYSSSPSSVAVPSSMSFLKGATFSVTYDYTPAAHTPVPGAAWLLGSGLLGLLGLRRKAILPALLLALFLGVSGQAQATPLTHSDSYALPTDLADQQSWTWSQHVDAFDTSLGTLSGVRLELTGNMIMDLSFESYDYANADNPSVSYPLAYSFTQLIRASFGNSTLFDVSPSIFKSVDLAAVEWVQFLDQSAPVAAGMTVASNQLAQYAGGFTLDLFADYPLVSTTETTENTIVWYDRVYDDLTLKVIYSYTPRNPDPAPVPEPSAVWLFGTGAACMAGALALRRRTKE